ncbi:mCG147534 [Mus musculus]|nr:mCG147534 [Mus musculus]
MARRRREWGSPATRAPAAVPAPACPPQPARAPPRSELRPPCTSSRPGPRRRSLPASTAPPWPAARDPAVPTQPAEFRGGRHTRRSPANYCLSSTKPRVKRRRSPRRWGGARDVGTCPRELGRSSRGREEPSSCACALNSLPARPRPPYKSDVLSPPFS